VEYVVNMYGETGSELHAGLGTDRFIVRWDLDSREVAEAAAGSARQNVDAPDAPVVNSRVEGGKPVPYDGDLPDAPRVLVEIPIAINETKRGSQDAGNRWRACTRRAFEHYLGRGMAVTGFHDVPGDRRVYSLAQIGARDAN
jgi:predicted GNAT superfamily acetyltransferase